MPTFLRPAALLFVALLPLAPARAVPYLVDVKPAWVDGPKLAPEEFKGRVVVVATWGVDCEICWSHVRRLHPLANKYPIEKVVVVANNIYGKITAKRWESSGNKGKSPVILMDFARFAKVDLDLPGPEVVKNSRKSGKFHMQVYDTDGRLAFDGMPGADSAAVIDRLAANFAPSPVVTPGAAVALFGKAVPPALMDQARQLATPGFPSAPALEKLQKTADGKDEKSDAPPEAARKMIERFNAKIAAEFKQAQEDAKDNPAKAHDIMASLATSVPQKDEGTRAKEQLAKWDKDRQFQSELAADRMWLTLKAKAREEHLGKNNQEPSAALTDEARDLIGKYPATQAAAKTRAAMDAGWKTK